MAIETIQVVEDIAIVLLVALGVAVVSYWLRQPTIIAYLIAGIIIGPYTPPASLIQQPEVLALLAQVGVVFLLLAVGLEMPLARLRSIGRRAIVIALAENLGTFAAGTFVGLAFRFPFVDALFLGLAVSVTSTILLSQLLHDGGVMEDSVAGLVLGITIVEDILVISLLGVIQSIAAHGTISLTVVAVSAALVLAFIGGALWIGGRLVPPITDRLARTQRTDLFLIGVLAVAFGLSFLANLVGLSIATGAFLAGVIVAESQHHRQAHDLVRPLKEVFGAIFFVSVGALMDIALVPLYLLPLVVLLLVSFVSNLGWTYGAARALGMSVGASRRTALSLAPAGGEMSLVVGSSGVAAGVAGAFVLPVVGALTIITSFLAPYLFRYAWGRTVPAATAAEA